MAYTDFLQYAYYGNTLQQYFLAFGIALGAIIVGKLVSILLRGYIRVATRKTKTMLDDILLNSTDRPLVFFVFVWGIYAGIKYLVLPTNIEAAVVKFLQILFTIAGTWLLVNLIDQIIVHYLVPFTKRTDSEIDNHLVPFVQKFVKVFIIVIAFIMVIGNLGYNITSLVTGLGIGGLAVALAAQSMLGNIFGGLSIMWDKPFKIGDRIRIDKYDGTVKEIGMRSTKIETLDGALLFIPNQTISSSSLENVTKEPARRIVNNIGLTYDTPSKKIRQAEEAIVEIIKKTKGTTGEYRIAFDKFADSSLNILVIYWIKDIDNLMTVMDSVNLQIKESLEKLGVEFAFPTRTVYMKK